MTSRWRKLGQLYVPRERGRHPKLRSHAANPLPIHLEGDVYRVFYCGRDSQNRSSIGAVDIDIAQRNVVNEHHLPFFEHGPPGSFFEAGISIGNCYAVDDAKYMLFMGWRTPPGEHWRGEIGRLRVSADLYLTLDGSQPLLGRDAIDPLSLSYPWVLARSPEEGYDMWYGSTLSWDAGNGEMLHVLQHARSRDGHRWCRKGLALPYALGHAQAFSRPAVLRDGNGRWEMWFSYRSGSGEKYRIGFARSDDGLHWSLDLAAAGISVSNHGWDSEMIEYPFVFDHAGARYLLYNGNSYGRSGFGLAILETSQ